MIIFTNILFIIIITSLLQSSAGHRPMIFGYSHSAPASCPAQIVSPLDLRESYTTFTETRSPFQNSFTPALVGSTADMASPLPFQHANTVRYVGAFSSLPEHSSFHSSLSDLELVDQPCRVSTSRLRMSWPVECTDWRLSSLSFVESTMKQLITTSRRLALFLKREMHLRLHPCHFDSIWNTEKYCAGICGFGLEREPRIPTKTLCISYIVVRVPWKP
jgi:hypothetical protein